MEGIGKEDKTMDDMGMDDVFVSYAIILNRSIENDFRCSFRENQVNIFGSCMNFAR